MVMPINKLNTLSGTIDNIVFVNKENGYAVLEIINDDNELVVAVGSLAELCVGEQIVFRGFYKSHINFGEQFKVEVYEVKLPEDINAIRKYLSAGSLPYIGPALAVKIVDTFKEKTLEIIATDMNKLSSIKGISPAKARKIQEEFKRKYSIREVISYMNSLNISAEKAITLFNVFGVNTTNLVKQNPYILCEYPIYEPFDIADEIAYNFNIEYNSEQRVSAGIVYLLRRNINNGHTCLPLDKLLSVAAEYMQVELNLINRHFEKMRDCDTVKIKDINNKTFVFLPEYLKAEMNIAMYLKTLCSMQKEKKAQSESLINTLEIIANIKYATLQIKAINEALTQKILVLTGGPGTGKTTTVNGIINAFESIGDRVALVAPTGRASKRLSELTARNATTIHRLLEVEYSKNNIIKFVHNENNKLKADVVIIDEMSMVDVLLFESLLCALKPTCKVIMVGDEDQLPSVGAGNILSSVILSGVVPCVRLNEVFRQAAQSDIVSNAHRIVKGEMLQLSGRDSDFFILQNNSELQSEQLVCELMCERLPQTYNYSMLEDIQILCPTKIGKLGTVNLNNVLQDKINPYNKNKPQIKLQDRIFRLGDKVMQIKNNYDLPYQKNNSNENGTGIFNGDLGIITQIDNKNNTVTVLSEERTYVYNNEFLYELELAYALTVHKSQGSEFEAVIMPIFDVPKNLIYRNLLYTGVTRAKKLCILVGRANIIKLMIDNVQKNKRYSCLSDFLLEY